MIFLSKYSDRDVFSTIDEWIHRVYCKNSGLSSSGNCELDEYSVNRCIGWSAGMGPGLGLYEQWGLSNGVKNCLELILGKFINKRSDSLPL